MKILVFADLHGNLCGLNALLETNDYKSADKTIFLGDIAFGCSRPNECITLLNKENITCILGNNDRYIAYNHIAEKELHTFDEGKYNQMKYMSKQISKENKEIMKSWLMDLEINIYGKKFYFVHFPWLDIDSDPYASPCPKEHTLETVSALFRDIDADYIIFGHEHCNYVIEDSKAYYCIDSLGLKEPSDYLVINCNEDSITFEHKQISFDMDKEIDLMDSAGYSYDKNKIIKKK